MPRYKLAIFDIDGTLLDTADGLTNAALEAIATTGIPMINEADIKQSIGPPLAKTLVQKGLLDPDNFELFNETFRSLYKEKYLMNAEMYPDVLEVLEKVHDKMKVAIATNKRWDYTQILMDKFNISCYCDVIEGTDFNNNLKKSDLINKCLQILKVDPKDAVMIGDTTNDMDSAISSNVDFIAVTYGFGFNRTNAPEKSVDSIADLLDLIL